MKNKYFVNLLCLLVLLSLLSISVSAAESGTCGENLTWSLDKTSGILTISGTGAMTNFEDVPWWDYRDYITEVIISEGCTSIGYSAFHHLTNLRSVRIPQSVVTIGGYAFADCSDLTEVSLDYVTEIGRYAFRNCTGLTKVTIPEGVTAISYGMFSSCRGLKEVSLHNKVTLIDDYAFDNCSALTDITLPDSVTEIGGSAFSSCGNLKTVKMGNAVQRIDNCAFSDCGKLESIRLSDALTKVSGFTFNNCKELKKVYLGASLREVDPTAFDNCKSLTEFTLSQENTALAVDRGVLYDANSQVLLLMPEGFSGTYTIPEGTTAIKSSAFDGAALTEISIPGTVTDIGKYAFSDCSSLTKVTLSEGLVQIRASAFARSAIRSICIPVSVTKIGPRAFSGCTELENIIFVGAPPEIDSAAFSGIAPTVTFPGSIAAWHGVTNFYGGQPKWVADCTAGHSPSNVPGTAADCATPGLTDGAVCLFCKKTVTLQNQIPALGHCFTDWVTIYEPSANQEGLAKRRCSTCGLIEENVLTQLPPITQQPVTHPSVTKPDITEPTATEPTPTEPAVTTPMITEPSVTPPTVTEPSVTEQEITQPSNTSTKAEKSSLSWMGIGVVAAIVAVGGGISFLLLKKKFHL